MSSVTREPNVLETFARAVVDRAGVIAAWLMRTSSARAPDSEPANLPLADLLAGIDSMRSDLARHAMEVANQLADAEALMRRLENDAGLAHAAGRELPTFHARTRATRNALIEGWVRMSSAAREVAATRAKVHELNDLLPGVADANAAFLREFGAFEADLPSIVRRLDGVIEAQTRLLVTHGRDDLGRQDETRRRLSTWLAEGQDPLTNDEIAAAERAWSQD